MKCPKCQTENPEDSRFCRKCGSSTESDISCPNCGSTHPPDSNFCNKCGHDLAISSVPTPKELSYDEKLEKIQRYLPEGLTEKILAQKGKIEGERKQITVMFCDMEGFTPLVEQLGPEEAYGIMDKVYEILIHKVHDYEGTVNEMTGDGIMALFGAPIALEDAPQRAIRSALAIHKEMAKFNDKLREERKEILVLRMRIGIHSGPVVVGTLGNNLRVEFKAVGDTVNFASRMEGLAEPGATYVTEDTFRLTEGFFRFEALGEKEVKGKKKPVSVYRVIAPSSQRTRFDVSAERGLTPLVGRNLEIELLNDGYERAKSGEGQAISIIAEAGLGKSRLLYEFRKSIAHDDVNFLEGKCLSYSRGASYFPLIDILKSNFDIGDGETDNDIREKVRNGLKSLKADEAATLPFILKLLSVKDDGIEKFPMSPEGRKKRITDAIKRIVIKGSQIRPLILAIEDLHWSDESTRDLLGNLLEIVPGSRLLIIFTYRPEFTHGWGGKFYYRQVTLNRLSNRESISMLNNVLGTSEISKRFKRFLLAKTEGVPLFIEEFLKSAKDIGIMEYRNGRYQARGDQNGIVIPATIQDVIMARVDSLRDPAKELIQTASVIQREFDYEMIKRLMPLKEKEILDCLSSLKDSELIYERGAFPQSTYIFRHALTHQVVYDSILTVKKKRLHEDTAKVIEEMYIQNLDEYFGVLAEHFLNSENYEKAAAYSGKACKKATGQAAYNEAISYAEQSISCLEHITRTDSIQRRIIDARSALATLHLNMGHFLAAYEAVFPIFESAVEMGYEKRLPRIYAAIGNYSLWIEEEQAKGFEYLAKAKEIAERIGDFMSLWFINFFSIWQYSWNCEFEKGIECFRTCQELSKMANNPLGVSTSANSICVTNYVFRGELNQAIETSRKALEIAEETKDILAQAFAYVSFGTSLYFKGMLVEAEPYLLEGMAICEDIHQTAWSSHATIFLGILYYDMGDYEKSRTFHEKSIGIMAPDNLSPSWINFNRLCIKRNTILTATSPFDVDEISNLYSLNKYLIYGNWMAVLIAEMCLISEPATGFSEAEKWIKKAIELNESSGTKWILGKCYIVNSNLLKFRGNLLEAKKMMETALEIFNEISADGWVEKYKKEIASLS